ncbi:hypothetical protein [Zeimonas arvi]|uniref:Uncharacterized protein n=1 Tax=Zeimonas arvi TaxID=2498847 RepID=A0A5C8NLS1_9BURK|nr:hypothetical protein [Zeimonas arvi]TXL62659.1 hypothetical protein FHP08_17705 [Zeimonas arvi]
MLDAWRSLARLAVRDEWYYERYIEFVTDASPFSSTDSSDANVGSFPGPQELAMVNFANACLLAYGFYAHVLPAKPASEIREDWMTIALNSAEIARKLQALKIETARANDLAYLLNTMLRRRGAAEGDIAKVTSVLRHLPTGLADRGDYGGSSSLTSSDFLEELESIARKRARVRPEGPRKRTPEVMRRTVVLDELCKFAKRTYKRPPAQAIATAVEVVLDSQTPLDVRQVREKLGSIREPRAEDYGGYFR